MPRIFFLHLDPWTCAQSQTLALAGALRAGGWDARIICRDFSALHAAAASRSLPVHALPRRGILTPPVLWNFFRALGAVPKDGPRLVHACDPAASRLASVAARLRNSLRLVHTRRMAGPAGTRPRYAPPPAGLVADSRAAAEALRDAGADARTVHMIPCGFDPADRAAREPRNDGRFVVAITGSLTADKGHLPFFDALSRLAAREDMPPWEARVLGQGPLFRPLLAGARSRGIDRRLAFLGGQDSRAQLRACDALALPAGGGEHCMPLVMRGWACGTPVVAARRAEYETYLADGENCLTVPPGDRESLAAALARLAGDPDLCERLRRGGLAAAARFPLARTADAHMALYRAVAGAEE